MTAPASKLETFSAFPSKMRTMVGSFTFYKYIKDLWYNTDLWSFIDYSTGVLFFFHFTVFMHLWSVYVTLFSSSFSHSLTTSSRGDWSGWVGEQNERALVQPFWWGSGHSFLHLLWHKHCTCMSNFLLKEQTHAATHTHTRKDIKCAITILLHRLFLLQGQYFSSS